MKEKINKKCKIVTALILLSSSGVITVDQLTDSTVKIIQAIKPTASSEDGMNDAGFVRYRQINENLPDTIKASSTK